MSDYFIKNKNTLNKFVEDISNKELDFKDGVINIIKDAISDRYKNEFNRCDYTIKKIGDELLELIKNDKNWEDILLYILKICVEFHIRNDVIVDSVHDYISNIENKRRTPHVLYTLRNMPFIIYQEIYDNKYNSAINITKDNFYECLNSEIGRAHV